jgi:hypothetical protein
VLISQSTGKILRVSFAKGRTHDFSLFKKSRFMIPTVVPLVADLGYIGAIKVHANTFLPHKSSKKKPLSKEQHRENTRLSKLRMKVEHCFATLKRYKILSGKYRNRRSRFGLRCTLIAMIHNLALSIG